jgi:putative flippase GtrA
MMKLIRYGAVSAIATSVSMIVLGALVASRTLTPGWANIVATGVGTVPSFELNRRWVWGKQGRRSVGGEVAPFAVLSFAGLALSTFAVSLAGHWAVGLPTVERTTAVEAASVAAFGSLWVLQFVLLDRLLFASRTRPPAMIRG